MAYKKFPEEIDFELLTKYFSGEYTMEEKRFVEMWVSASKKNEELIISLKILWEAAGSEYINVDTNAAWENVCKRIESENEINQDVFSPLVNKVSLKGLYQRFASAAAIILVMIGGYVILQQTGIFNKHEDIKTFWNQRQTHAGEKSIIKFNDGTQITLNANSKLKYPINFINNKREVYLEGEAFFEVAHDPSKPFIVYSNNISTTVLGTKFNINAYSDEEEIAISLVEGKINVSENVFGNINKTAFLHPNQQFFYSAIKKTYKIKDFDVEEITGWKDNLLKFNDETLKNVFVRLERAYGVKFEVEIKPFENYLITANFHNSSLLTVIEAIKKLTGLDYITIKENDQVKKIIFSQRKN